MNDDLTEEEKQFIVELGNMEFTPERAGAVCETIESMFTDGFNSALRSRVHFEFKYALGQYAVRIARAKRIDTFRKKFAQHFLSP